MKICYYILVMSDFSYLSPPRTFTKKRFSYQQCFEYIHGKPFRRIFGSTQYQSFEHDAIQKLKDYLRKKAPNVYYPDQLLLRFSYNGNFLMSEVKQKVTMYDSWHQNQIITVLNQNGRRILEEGHIYSYGRDYEYCPIIILKVHLINLKIYTIENYFNAIHGLLKPIEEHMLFGGIIEKWNLIVDFQDKKYKEETFTKELQRIAPAYPYRLKRLLFVNANKNETTLGQIKNILISINSDAYVETVTELSELIRYIGRQQREERYGGTERNLCEFWPIRTTNHNLQDSMQGEIPSEQTEYQSVYNDEEYFNENVPLCDLSNTKCNIY